MLEKFGKYTSFFSVLLFVGAVWFEYLFYNGFGVQIFTFISFSEIIGLFIGYIPILIFIAFMVCFFIGMFTLPLYPFLRKVWNIEKYNLQERRRINSKLKIISYYVMTGCLILIMGPFLSTSGKLVRSEGYFYLKI